MAIERRSTPARPARRGLPLPAVIAIGALAAFGAITLVQWFLASIIGVAKFVLFVVIVVAVAAWVVNTKGSR